RFDPERDLDVSSRHAAVIRQGATFLVRDLGSTNGTFVNGRQITGDAALNDGDVIAFGQTGPAVEFPVGGGDAAAEGVPAALRSGFQTELATVRDALRQSQAEVARLRTELAATGSTGDARVVARLRAALDTAEARQRGLAGAAAVDYRAISQKNQEAVALLV